MFQTILFSHVAVLFGGFYVDGVPVRQFKNPQAAAGVPYPSGQPMAVYMSIWDGDAWATDSGRVKIDRSKASFTASYANFTGDGCVAGLPGCGENRGWYSQRLGGAGLQRRIWFLSTYMIDLPLLQRQEQVPQWLPSRMFAFVIEQP